MIQAIATDSDSGFGVLVSGRWPLNSILMIVGHQKLIKTCHNKFTVFGLDGKMGDAAFEKALDRVRIAESIIHPVDKLII